MVAEICRVIGANIRLRRQHKNWTLSRLARVIGISYQQLQKYEKGTNRLPCDMLVKLAAEFGCTLDELCGFEKSPYSPEVQELIFRIAGIASPQLRRRLVAVVEAVISAQLTCVDAF